MTEATTERGNSMRNVLLTAVATATLAAALAVDAQAIPSAPRSIGQEDASTITVVRDGCGWNRYYSSRLRRCVWNWRR
jgi:hypothetical protein